MTPQPSEGRAPGTGTPVNMTPPTPMQQRARHLAAGQMAPHALYDSALISTALACEGQTWSVTGLHSKGNKYIVFGELSDLDASTSDTRGPRQLVAKVYASNRGRPAHDALVELWHAGFREPSPYQVARPYGYVEELSTLFQERVKGPSWADSLAEVGPVLESASRQAAEWLLALQALPPRGTLSSVAEQIGSISRCLTELAASFPEQAPSLEQIRRALTARLGEDRSPAVPAHGDYHPSNIYVSRGQVTVIDFDTYGLRTPAFDVGYALGQLVIMSFLTAGSPMAGARAGRTFWTRYARDGAARWRHVAAQVARTLVQSLHYELCTFRTGRHDLIPLWLGGVEAWLSASGPEVFAAPFGTPGRTSW